MTAPRERYPHGHHESVLRSRRWRTAAISAGYLLTHLHAGQDMLDVGCGPGEITLDVARPVTPGRQMAPAAWMTIDRRLSLRGDPLPPR